MKSWYKQFWAQNWYRNTFLVNEFEQIAQVQTGDEEWNNVYDSGCNFACIAMIIGVDPAHLASILGKLHFFSEDRNLRAKTLSGAGGGLVWDRNFPRKRELEIPRIWHSERECYVTVRIRRVRIDKTDKLSCGREFVSAARNDGFHLICGPTGHSHLVAGSVGKSEYFVWDPNGEDEDWCIEESLAGKVTLERLFSYYRKRMIYFLSYELDIENLKPRAEAS